MINYPISFDDWSDGVDISNEQINEWIKEGIEKLENNKHIKEYRSTSLASGNTIVHIARVWDDYHQQHFYAVDVCKNYKSIEVYLNEE